MLENSKNALDNWASTRCSI